MATQENYTVKPFSMNRKNITLILKEGKRKHTVFALLELDITTAKSQITHQKKKGVDISFTGWLVKCVAEAVSTQKELNSYRQGRNKTIVFDEVDVPITIERSIGQETRPVSYIIRQANQKTVRQITKEIREVQQQYAGEKTQRMGPPLSRLERIVLGAPFFVKRLIILFLRKRGKLKKKYMGTVGVTSIGMLGHFPGWVIPLGGPLATLVAVGGITKKPSVVQDQICIRKFLHITIAVDHDLVDGGPLVRFVDQFSKLIETSSFLETP